MFAGLGSSKKKCKQNIKRNDSVLKITNKITKMYIKGNKQYENK